MLSFEVGDNNSEVDKELVQSMHLVLSGNCFNGNDYFTDNNIEEIGQEIERSNSFTAIMSVNSDNDQEFLKIQRSDETLKEVADEKNVSNKCSDQPVCLRDSRDKVESSNSDTQYDTASSHQKYGTLGSVFRKASSKFIRRDVDIFLRNSKSLPRDTSKLVATESIKSILDDCHSSAANVLQKSRSLLKNTQTIFKTLSQSRFSTHGSINNLDKQKFSPSESDVSESEKKLTFLRKEDFTKAKIIIKSKLEKTFKTESKSFPEKKDFVPGEKEEEERCRKVLPKSPLVYKSQFVKSQINVQNNSFENVALKSSLKEMNKQSEIAGTASHTLFIPITNDQSK